MVIDPGNSVTLDIYSQTVENDGDTYKLEDTSLYVQFGALVRSGLSVAEPLVVPEETNFLISGIDALNGAFYHPVLGLIYFAGDLTEESPPDDLTSGELNFYDGADEINAVFHVYFGYDAAYNGGEGATVYELGMDNEDYTEIGYFIDGTFVPDPSAPPLG